MAGVGARWHMCWLLFLTRGVCQGNRVLLGALVPFISDDIEITEQEKGFVLAAFSTGYMLTQIAGGTAADRIGGKLLILFAITMMSLGSLAAPTLLSSGGLRAFGLCYFVMGLSEGPSYPTTGSMLSKWIPAHERGAALSIVDTGSSVAAMLTFSVAPVLADAFSWRFAFRCVGYASLCVCGIWAVVASNNPRECAYMSEDERKYLVSSGMPVVDVYGRAHHSPETPKSELVPADNGEIRKQERTKPAAAFPVRLFFYASAWATIAAHSAFNFGRYFVYNNLTSYYVEVVGTSKVVAGQQLLLGQLADTVGKFGFAPFVDAAIKEQPSSKTRVRKTVSGIAFVSFAAAMLVMATSSSLRVVTTALVACKIASSAHVCGFKTIYLDLTSKHTGSLSGVSNTFATLAAMVSPLVAGHLLADVDRGWPQIFFLIAVVNVVAAVFWALFASADSLDDKISVAKGAL